VALAAVLLALGVIALPSATDTGARRWIVPAVFWACGFCILAIVVLRWLRSMFRSSR
jgi:hypothetical protein